MEVEFISDKDCIRVVLSGEIDEYGAKMVRADIDGVIENTRDLRSMIFDMKNVTFIDSTGLGFVLGRYKKLRNRHFCLPTYRAKWTKFFARAACIVSCRLWNKENV